MRRSLALALGVGCAANLASAATNYSITYNSPYPSYLPPNGWKVDDTSAGTAYTNISLANVTVTFTGSAVYLLASLKFDRNQLRLHLDGQDVGAANEYQSQSLGTSAANTVIWSKTDLDDTSHTLLAWNDPAVGTNPKPWAAWTGIIYTTDQGNAIGTQLPPGQGGVSSPGGNPSSNQNSNSNGPSTAVIAGVATGVAVLCIIVLGAIAYAYLRRRAARRRERREIEDVQRVEPFEVIDASSAGRPFSGVSSQGKAIGEEQHGVHPTTQLLIGAVGNGAQASYHGGGGGDQWARSGVDEYGRPLHLQRAPPTGDSIAMSSIHAPSVFGGTPGVHPARHDSYLRPRTESYHAGASYHGQAFDGTLQHPVERNPSVGSHGMPVTSSPPLSPASSPSAEAAGGWPARHSQPAGTSSMDAKAQEAYSNATSSSAGLLSGIPAPSGSGVGAHHDFGVEDTFPPPPQYEH